MKFYSQDGQDKFLARLFRNKKDGFFIDIGAYDGVNISNTLFFEQVLFWKGICIEPNPIVFEDLKINRQCVCLNCCVSDKKGYFKFLSVSGWGIMLSGLLDFFDEKHLQRIERTIAEHGGSKEIINVSAMPLKDVFSEYSVKCVDYCTIDVEGGEISVLQSIDFSKVTIKVFTIENNNRSKTVRNFLQPLGYKLIGKLGADEVYELNSIRYDLILKWKIEKKINSIKLMWTGLSNKYLRQGF